MSIPDSAAPSAPGCPVHAAAPAAIDPGLFDPFGEHAVDAYRHLATFRREQPVFHSAVLGAWCVTRDADIRAVCSDPATYSSFGVFPRAQGLPRPAQAVLDYRYDHGTVTELDPPAHGPIRRAMHVNFGPRALSGDEPGGPRDDRGEGRRDRRPGPVRPGRRVLRDLPARRGDAGDRRPRGGLRRHPQLGRGHRRAGTGLVRDDPRAMRPPAAR